MRPSPSLARGVRGALDQRHEVLEVLRRVLREYPP
jgi:hypothetical protein